MAVLYCVLYSPPAFCCHPSKSCQSLNILCVCRDACVIRVSLSCGWPQTATAETVEIHTLGVQYAVGGHIAWYIPPELYIEADHTTVVWPLFKKQASQLPPQCSASEKTPSRFHMSPKCLALLYWSMLWPDVRMLKTKQSLWWGLCSRVHPSGGGLRCPHYCQSICFNPACALQWRFVKGQLKFVLVLFFDRILTLQTYPSTPNFALGTSHCSRGNNSSFHSFYISHFHQLRPPLLTRC